VTERTDIFKFPSTKRMNISEEAGIHRKVLVVGEEFRN
jgi:hypothetical protein